MEEVDIQGHNGANQTQTESTADEINPTLVGDIHVEARSRRDRAR